LEEQELLLTSLQMTDDRDDLLRLLNELLARMHEYLEEMGRKLQVDEVTCRDRVMSLSKQNGLYADANLHIGTSILPVKDSLAEDQNQFKVLQASIATLAAEIQATTETKAATDAAIPIDRLELTHKTEAYGKQMQSLEALRKKLEAVLEAWSEEQVVVENGLNTYAAFPYEHECNDTLSWAIDVKHREMDDVALVGGCKGCVSSCANNAVVRSTRLAQCGAGGLKIAHRCQRVANKHVLKAPVAIKGECDTTQNWGMGNSGAENLVRLGGRPNRVASCPAGALLTGWGIQSCGNKAGLQFALECSDTGLATTVQEVKGKCVPSVHAWGSGTHYPHSSLAQMMDATCPEGSYMSGLGMRHCDSSQRHLRWIAQCSAVQHGAAAAPADAKKQVDEAKQKAEAEAAKVRQEAEAAKVRQEAAAKAAAQKAAASVKKVAVKKVAVKKAALKQVDAPRPTRIARRVVFRPGFL